MTLDLLICGALVGALCAFIVGFWVGRRRGAREASEHHLALAQIADTERSLHVHFRHMHASAELIETLGHLVQKEAKRQAVMAVAGELIVLREENQRLRSAQAAGDQR